MTFGQLLEEWLSNYVVHNTAPRTRERYEEIAKLHLIPALGSVPTISLSPQYIQKYYTFALEAGRRDGKGGLKPRTVRKHHGIIFQALRYGVRHGIIANNPAALVDPPPLEELEPVVPSTEDTERILEKAQDTPYHILFYTKCYTGLRRGELLGLRWSDIDFKDATLSVTRTLQQLKSGEYIFKKPKNKRSKRQIDLSPTLVFLLWNHKVIQEEQKRLMGLTLSATDLVFCHPEGRPLRPNSLTRAFHDIAQSLSLSGVTLHSLRHAHATFMLKNNVHPKIVQERLGHSTIATTLDIYSHVVPGLQKAATRRFEDCLPGASLGESERKVAEKIVGKLSAISEILPLERILV